MASGLLGGGSDRRRCKLSLHQKGHERFSASQSAPKSRSVVWNWLCCYVDQEQSMSCHKFVLFTLPAWSAAYD